MTTIAYKDGVFAYDSRMTAYSTIVDDDFEKSFTEGEEHLIYCGDVGDMEHFVYCYFQNKTLDRNLDCEALVFRKGRLHCVDVVSENDVPRFRKIPLRKDNHYAIGSGTKLALAFMDCGLSAYEAVEKTMLRDPFTGGKIRTINIK